MAPRAAPALALARRAVSVPPSLPLRLPPGPRPACALPPCAPDTAARGPLGPPSPCLHAGRSQLCPLAPGQPCRASRPRASSCTRSTPSPETLDTSAARRLLGLQGAGRGS